MKIRRKSRIQLAVLLLALFSGIGWLFLAVKNLNAIRGHYFWFGIGILIIVAGILVYKMPLLTILVLLLTGILFFATGYFAVMPGLPLLIAGGLAIWSCSADLEAIN